MNNSKIKLNHAKNALFNTIHLISIQIIHWINNVKNVHKIHNVTGISVFKTEFCLNMDTGLGNNFHKK